MTDLNANLLWELQQGIPLESAPFRAIGERLGISVAEVLETIRRLMAEGTVRRMGAVFDARRLGYRSALCAMDVPAAEIAHIAATVCAHRGVTHGYERGWPAELATDLTGGPHGRYWPNFWFTLATEREIFDSEMDGIRRAVAPYPLLVLPALRRFKIDVTFDPRTRERDERVPATKAVPAPRHGDAPAVFSTQDRAIVRALEGNLPLVERPFAAIAADLGMAESALLERLAAWSADGVLRRVALIVRHRQLGFTANGMCTWDVPEAEVVEAGRRVAAHPAVTHCYQRERTDRFPFTLYAMIHTGSWEETRQLFLTISQNAGLTPGQLLLSLNEYKKTSMTYFPL
ncbi:MAG: hypothetical protein WCH61_08220 [bacterium]